jgi:GTPase SAR1 family protein
MHFCPEVPQILVGTKLDARSDQALLEKLKNQGQKPVTTEQVRFGVLDAFCKGQKGFG